MTRDKFDELKDKLDTKDIDQKLWVDYNNEVYKIIDDNEKLKDRLNSVSRLIRKYAWAEKSKDINRVVVSLTNEQWEELIKLLEDFNVD